MSAEEATINPDGSATFEEPIADSGGADGGDKIPLDDSPPVELPQGVDPAIYVVLALIFGIALYYYFAIFRKKSVESEADSFFSNLDGDKFNLKLPKEVEDYYAIKDKAVAAGWEPGQGPGASGAGAAATANGPGRILAQALMKRAMADIPMVTHVQKESAGMNKLYSQSMCSVNQWRSYQAAEALVSSEVEDVRAEADDIEPGWSGVIWRQAMQYHTVIKQKHEQEQKAAEEEVKKRREIEQKVMAAKAAEQAPESASKGTPGSVAKVAPAPAPIVEEDNEAAKEKAAERAAEELIKMEEREKDTKKAFSGKGGMKKGFLDGANKGKKKK